MAVADLSPAEYPAQPLSPKARRLEVLLAMNAAVEQRDSWEEVTRLLKLLEEIG